jgi:rhamnulokinase
VDQALTLTGRDVDVVHLVGGGARNDLLAQLTADRCGRRVTTGPVEATSLGNLLVQARAHGSVSGGLDDLRRAVRTSAELRSFEPSAGHASRGPA